MICDGSGLWWWWCGWVARRVRLGTQSKAKQREVDALKTKHRKQGEEEKHTYRNAEMGKRCAPPRLRLQDTWLVPPFCSKTKNETAVAQPALTIMRITIT